MQLWRLACGTSTIDDIRGLKVKPGHCGSIPMDSYLLTFFLFKSIYYTDSMHKVYKDKLQNCSCNQFHYIGTYKQEEKNSMTKNRSGNNSSEK